MAPTSYEFDALWDGEAWHTPGYVTVDAGLVKSLTVDTEHAERIAGVALPGVANLHSHAFQRAMAGLTERTSGGNDSFWTWRSAMYRVAHSIDGDQLEAVATQLYVEMLRCGFTSVAEFHYLHHQMTGEPYEAATELSERILRAAARAGIDLMLLPVLYEVSGFGQNDASDSQRRFIHTPDSYLRLLDDLTSVAARQHARLGVALHSLRAVRPDSIRAIHNALPATPSRPVHIHIAEQPAEVDACVEHHGRRPVAFLSDTVGLTPYHCLVHATHIDDAEIAQIAQADAVIGVCPTTEANLGDGVLPAAELLTAGTRLGVGSDSHISVDLREELRWLEYGQRLRTGTRNVLASGNGSVGSELYRAAQAAGAAAVGIPQSGLREGAPANLIVLDALHPSLCGRRGTELIDAFVFGNTASNPIDRVMVRGTWVIQGGHHESERPIAERFRAAIAQLASV